MPVYMDWGFVQAIFPHAHRISSLTFVVSSISDLVAFLGLEMPFLETLFCSNSYHMAENMNIDTAARELPRAGAFPRLHTLRVTGSVLCPALAFPTLRSLNVYCDPREDINDLLDFFEACPWLRVIRFQLSQNSQRNPDVTHTIGARPAASLPSLLFCHIDNQVYHEGPGVSTWVSTFLHKVHFPATAQLRVNCPLARYVRLSTFIPFSPPAPFIRTLDTLELRFMPLGRSRPGEWSLVVKGYRDGSRSLAITMTDAKWSREAQSSGPSDILFDLARSFSHSPSSSLAALRLEFGSGVSVVRNDWLLLLQTLPTLGALTVRIDSSNNLLTVLRKNPGLCPALRTLSITCDNGSGVHGALLTVVELRVREGQGLENLTFRGSEGTPLSVGRLERLMAMVPNVVTS
ncbi:hypothetical protein C8T65DRAFT_737637 [Cerioporus squamosus]|nr:hypothetical protein C8T65DRAFT_737637 [Cerioporus squamosus]